MNFTVVPPDVHRLLVGHLTKQLPPPSGSFPLVPAGHWYDHCFCIMEAVRKDEENRRLEAKTLQLPARIYSNYRLRDEGLELAYRKIDPKTGKVVEEGTNRKKLELELNVRGPRKQGAARANVKWDLRDTKEIPVMASTFELDSNGKIVNGSIKEEIVDWVRNPRDHAINQDYRMTSFKTGEKYSGPLKDKLIAANELRNLNHPKPEPVHVKDVYELRQEKMQKLEDSIRKLMGLLKK